MKSVKFWFVALFMASPILIFSNFRPAPTSTLRANVVGESGPARVRVVVDKPQRATVVVRVLDSSNWLVHEQTLNGSQPKVQMLLNVCGLPDGNYRMEITDGHKIHAHAINVSTADHPSAPRSVAVHPVD